jgi:hypothetical protein
VQCSCQFRVPGHRSLRFRGAWNRKRLAQCAVMLKGFVYVLRNDEVPPR